MYFTQGRKARKEAVDEQQTFLCLNNRRCAVA
jgi:hypothetical protein